LPHDEATTTRRGADAVGAASTDPAVASRTAGLASNAASPLTAVGGKGDVVTGVAERAKNSLMDVEDVA
jgi:hypothetical protein